jgi:hypothetical protein
MRYYKYLMYAYILKHGNMLQSIIDLFPDFAEFFPRALPCGYSSLHPRVFSCSSGVRRRQEGLLYSLTHLCFGVIVIFAGKLPCFPVIHLNTTSMAHPNQPNYPHKKCSSSICSLLGIVLRI